MSRAPIYDVLERHRCERERDRIELERDQRWMIPLTIWTALIAATLIGYGIYALATL